MAAISGARGSAATLGVSSNQLPIDMADQIFRLEPNNNPLVLIATMLNKTVATQAEYKHLEDARLPRYSQCNNGGGYTSVDTKIVVDDGTAYRAGYLIRNITSGEVMRITAMDPDGDNANEMTISRSWGATAAAAIADDAYLYHVQDSHAENADIVDPQTTTPTQVTNYTGITRTSIGISGTADAIRYYGEKEIVRQRINAGLQHADVIERGFLLGQKNANTSGNYPIRSTGGFHEFVSPYTQTTAALTQAVFLTFLRKKAFAEGSDEKWLFCSGIITEAIMSWALGKVEMHVSDETYGINILKWISPFGTLNIKTHKGLEKMGFDGTIAGGKAFIIDPSAIGYKHLEGRDTKLLPNRQGNGVDGQLDEYLTECGLWLRNEATHAVLEGVTSFT